MVVFFGGGGVGVRGRQVNVVILKIFSMVFLTWNI